MSSFPQNHDVQTLTSQRRKIYKSAAQKHTFVVHQNLIVLLKWKAQTLLLAFNRFRFIGQLDLGLLVALTGSPWYQYVLNFSFVFKLKKVFRVTSYILLSTIPWDSGYRPCGIQTWSKNTIRLSCRDFHWLPPLSYLCNLNITGNHRSLF